MIKVTKISFGVLLLSMATILGCKKEKKGQDAKFSWDEAETEAVDPTTKKEDNNTTADSDFTFDDTEEDPLDNPMTSVTKKKVPKIGNVKVIDGSLRNYSGYDADAQLLLLAAAKLCTNFDYPSALGTHRIGNMKNGSERITVDDCCAAFVPSPYVEPMEYYISTYFGNTEINEYRSNVFKLQEIRAQLKTDYQTDFLNLLKEVNPNQLVSYKLVSASITGYDLEKKLLNIKYRVNGTQQIGYGNHATVVPINGGRNRYSNSYTYAIEMSGEAAKKIFEYYGNLNDYNKNPPFNLVAKTSFSLQVPKFQKRPFNFESHIGKIEFYLSAEGYPKKENKLAEIQFTKTIDS